MKHSLKTRVLSLLLAALMVLGMAPMTTFATETEQDGTVSTEATEATATTEATEASDGTAVVLSSGSDSAYDTSVSSEYFNVLSEKVYNLAPGATETEIILNNDSGTDRKVVHVFTVDTKNESIEVLPGYYGIDKLNPDDLSDRTNWKTAGVSVTAQYYQDTLGYNVVGAMNTSLAYDSDAPYDFMVYNGVVLADNANHPTSNAATYLVIYKDGTCELRSRSTPLDGTEWQAVSANFNWIVKDGAMVKTTVERDDSDASRSMIGIKADGTLVFCLVDGRNAPTSSGLSSYELGEMMLALGCVNAVNCDGGGSSSFVSKREGESKLTMRSVPSDGAERPTINSVIIVSKAKATGEFDHAVLSSAYDYVAPGANVVITADGVDAGGFAAEVPADVTWQLSDSTMGTVENGVFTAGTTEGEVTVQLVYNGEVVGEKTLNIVTPASFGFDVDSTVVPYGKAVTLNVVATYGADSWGVSVDGAYSLALSDSTAATLNGSTLTATSDESKTGVNVTVTYLPDTTKTDVIAVTYGKGSEIVFNFEDGDVSKWMGFDEAKQWNIDNSVSNTLTNSNPDKVIGGQFSPEVDSNTFLATRENGGQVKNGNYALGLNLDNTNASFAGWTYNILYYVGAPKVLRDVANGQEATSFGMWMYIPEGAAGLAMQLTVYCGSSADKLNPGAQLHFYFTTADGTRKNLNSCTEADIPESRWVYASVDLTGYNYVSLVDPTGNIYREPTFIRTYIKPTEPAVHTFYFDDFTLDYSSAVEDRVLPTITDVSYATADTAVALAEGATINSNTVAFSASTADNAGLDYTTGKIYVDGVALSGVTASGKVLSSGDVTLTSGVHTVTFEIKDMLGNAAKVTRTFTVAGDALITLSGHNDSGAAPEYDSIYYVDINTSDISAINSITTTLKLQNANTWELDGMVAAAGFEASYVYNEISGLLTVTVKKTDDVPTPLTTEQTLVSIPVRVWSWDAINHVTGAVITPEAQFKTGYCPIVSIDCEITYGSVEFAEGAYAGYSSAFGGEISVATNLNDNINPWHVHDTELTVLNQEATCLTDGYTDRTYCETCQSVIDWGTKIEGGHIFEIVNDQLVCECGETITGSGLVTVNGKIYCLISDKLVTGWQMVGDAWCYAAVSTKEVQTGEFTVNGLTYTADETGVVVKGAWVTDANGTKYSYGPAFYTRSWHEIDGVTYYFGTDSYMYTGIRSIPVNRNNPKEGVKWYEFAENGAFIKEMTDYTGFLTENGVKYYVKDGMNYYGGLMLIDGYYYYARTSGEVVCGKSYWITTTNDLLPAAMYTFDEEGKMIDPPAAEPEIKNGIVEDNGVKYWYVDGVKTYGGLLYLDTDNDGTADAYYYARTSGLIVCGQDYWITKTNDLLPATKYTFGEDGKMIDPPVVEEPEVPVEPEVKNGICADETGKLYYYVDDVKTYGGLLHLDTDNDGVADAYYYARTSGLIVCGQDYWITKTNDLLPATKYTFGEDGKMIDPPATEEPEQPTDPTEPEVKNGIVEENGTLYWYVNGEKAYGGLMLIDGYYYYARTHGEIVCGRDYWITKTNDLLPAANYTFGEDGKMINPPAAE